MRPRRRARGDDAMVRQVLTGGLRMTLAGLAAAVLVPILGGSTMAQPYKLKLATVGVPPSLHTLYMHVALEEGIYRRNGLAVDDLTQLTAGPLVTQALIANR